jgi:putative SOS response-associated peptidase YedK
MCDRYSFSLPREKIVRRFGIKVAGAVEAQYNISPGQTIAVITDEQPHQLTQATWGLPQGNGVVSQVFVKSTTEKPVARTAQLLSRRCLVLADGFYLWKRVSRKSRIPYRVTLKWNMPFVFAGVWQTRDEEPGKVYCALVVTDSNDLITPVSDRMPLVLSLEQEKEWLKLVAEWSELTRYILPYAPDKMRLFPVSAQVNQPEINSPELILPAQPTDQFGNYVLFE